MNKKIVGVVVLATALMCNPAHAEVPTGFYAHAGIVTDVRDGAGDWYIVTVEDMAGMIWEFEDDADDWFEGDLAALMMWDMQTPDNVYDDQIMDARYVGTPDMFCK